MSGCGWSLRLEISAPARAQPGAVKASEKVPESGPGAVRAVAMGNELGRRSGPGHGGRWPGRVRWGRKGTHRLYRVFNF